MRVQEVRIAGINGVAIPDDATMGSVFTLTLRVQVASIDQELIEVARDQVTGQSVTLPGSKIVGLVVVSEEA